MLIIEGPNERKLHADWRHIHRWVSIIRAARRTWGPCQVTIGLSFRV